MPIRDDDPELLARLLDELAGIVFLLDAELRIVWVNRAAAEVFGYDLDAALGRSVLEFIDPDWDPEAIASIGTAMEAHGPRLPMVFRAFGPDGRPWIAEVTANTQFDDPVLRGMVVTARPWNERWLLDQTLDAMAAGRPAEESLQLLVEVIGAETMSAPGSLVFDLDGDRAAGVVAAHELPPELSGPVAGCGDAVADAWRVLLAERGGRVHEVDTLPAGLREPAERLGRRTLWVWPAESTDGAGRPSAWAIAWRDEPHLDVDQSRRRMMTRLANLAGLIVDRARADAANAFAATHDGLTGLRNRTSFYDELEAALDEPGGTASAIGVVIADLDGFKPVNDRWGHGAGDRALAEIGARLAATAPPGTLVARVGGDEFAAICRCHHDELEPTGRAFADAVLAPIDLGDGRSTRVGVSVGVAAARRGDSADSLVEAADRALYSAKRRGGGVQVAGDPHAPDRLS